MSKHTPTHKERAEFVKHHDRLTVLICNDVVAYGKTVLNVMKDTGVSEDFDFKGMAILSVRKALQNKIDELNEMLFEHDEITPLIKEITKSFSE